jgi:hypothetical protein
MTTTAKAAEEEPEAVFPPAAVQEVGAVFVPAVQKVAVVSLQADREECDRPEDLKADLTTPKIMRIPG